MFLKLKDTVFYENAVRPFLTNKIEKTFVDYWLLDFDFAMKEYLQPNSKILIIFQLFFRTGAAECFRTMPPHPLLEAFWKIRE